MKRSLLALLVSAIITSISLASAAALHVDGGVLQTFTLSGDALNLPDPSKTLHQVLSVQDFQFTRQGVECVEDDALLWVGLRNARTEVTVTEATLELWYRAPEADEDAEFELIEAMVIALPGPGGELRYEMRPLRGVGDYRFKLVFAGEIVLATGTPAVGQGEDLAASAASGDSMANWSGEIPVDEAVCATLTPTLTPTPTESATPTGTPDPQEPTATVTPTLTPTEADGEGQQEPGTEEEEPTATPTPAPVLTSTPTVAPEPTATPTMPDEPPPAEPTPAEAPPAEPTQAEPPEGPETVQPPAAATEAPAEKSPHDVASPPEEEAAPPPDDPTLQPGDG